MAFGSNALLVMACSATKLSHAARAIDLYRGVMFETFRANVRPDARPHVVILSSRHGFLAADAVIEPYEQRMTAARADFILSRLEDFIRLDWPAGIETVLLAGGTEYRRLMRAALVRLREQGAIAQEAVVSETSGGIGYQRQQLGAFLRGL